MIAYLAFAAKCTSGSEKYYVEIKFAMKSKAILVIVLFFCVSMK
jgi:hypothetical protein